MTLAHNPSHLEFVGRVWAGVGETRAEHDPTAALPVVVPHGDAAFAGQGVVAETLTWGAFRGTAPGRCTITNNQVGFTTDVRRRALHPADASDLAKGFHIPIIHVSG